MKKFILLALILCALLVTGCGTDKEKIGVIRYLNTSEKSFDASLHANNQSLNHEHIFFENLPTMIDALQAGHIDTISIYDSVANYLVAQNPDMHFKIADPVVMDIFCFAMREDETELQKEFNSAIFKISKSGKLAQLVKKYIGDFNRAEEPPAVELPTFHGAPTIKIGVTGDLPLLDYIRADGQPAGFNTAVLAEISRIIGKNFVLVQVDSGARSVALSSGRIDVIFWAVKPKADSAAPENFDKPEKMIFTKSYFADVIVHVHMKK